MSNLSQISDLKRHVRTEELMIVVKKQLRTQELFVIIKHEKEEEIPVWHHEISHAGKRVKLEKLVRFGKLMTEFCASVAITTCSRSTPASRRLEFLLEIQAYDHSKSLRLFNWFGSSWFRTPLYFWSYNHSNFIREELQFNLMSSYPLGHLWAKTRAWQYQLIF